MNDLPFYQGWRGDMVNPLDELRRKTEARPEMRRSPVMTNPFPKEFPVLNWVTERHLERVRAIQRMRDEARQLQKVKGLRTELSRLVEESR